MTVLYTTKRAGFPGLTKDGKLHVEEIGKLMGLASSVGLVPRVPATVNCHITGDPTASTKPRHVALVFLTEDSGGAGDGWVIARSNATTLTPSSAEPKNADSCAVPRGFTATSPFASAFDLGQSLYPMAANAGVFVEWQLEATDPDPDWFVEVG